MALNITSNVLTVYKADTSGQKAAIRDLRGEERKAATERLDELDRHNAGLDRQIAFVGRLGVAVGVAAGAFTAANAAFRTYQQEQQLRTAAQGADLDALRNASKGLIADMELLKFAAANMNADFGANNEEMRIAIQAMLSLRKQGNDLGGVIQGVTKALVEGSAEGLKPFGVIIKETSDKADAKRQIMARLREEAGKFGGDYKLAGDDIQKASVSLENSFHKITVAVGELAAGFAPLIEALATIVTKATDAAMALSRVPGFETAKDVAATIGRYALSPAVGTVSLIQAAGGLLDGGPQSAGRTRDDIREQLGREQLLLNAEHDAEIARRREEIAQADRDDLVHLSASLAASQRAREAAAKARAEAAKSRASSGGRATDRFGIGEIDLGPAGEMFTRRSRIGDMPEGVARVQAANPRTGDFAASLQDVAARQALMQAASEFQFAPTDPRARLESVFGPIEEIDGYATAFGALQGAVTSAFDAWVSGSGSVTEAVKKAIAGSVAAMGREMLINALKHTAYGVGALALGPLAGASAAGHFKAAALFSAGAVAAGVTARALGSGESATAARRPSATDFVDTSRAGSAGPTTVVIVAGPGVLGSDRRRNAANFRQAQVEADRLTGATTWIRPG